MNTEDKSIRDFQVLVTFEPEDSAGQPKLVAALKSALHSDDFNEISHVQVKRGQDSSDVDLSFTLKARSNPDAQRLVNSLMTKLSSATTKPSKDLKSHKAYAEVGRRLRPGRSLAAT